MTYNQKKDGLLSGGYKQFSILQLEDEVRLEIWKRPFGAEDSPNKYQMIRVKGYEVISIYTEQS